MHKEIFHAYDIRGLVPQEIDETVARRLGKVLAHLYHPQTVLVGHDMRTTSSALETALVEGLTVSGINVRQIGLCSTPMFNFAVGEAGDAIQLGVMVTASHNSSQYNGFKLVHAGAVPIGEGSGMEKIRDACVSDEALFDANAAGHVETDDGVLERYLDKIFSLVSLPSKFPDWRVAMDAGNGMNGLVLPKMRKRLSGLEVVKLFWDLDGTFSNHEANPLKVETLKDVRQAVLKNSCAFGVAFDGDGDRCGFVDEQGTPIPGDLMTALLAREVLRLKGPSKILYDLRSSWAVPEIIREAGGEPVMCRVGHSFIKQLMRDEAALFGGEMSMHYYFSDLWNAESGDLAMLMILQMLVREQKPLSQIWKSFQRYAHSREINFSVKDGVAILSRVEEAYRSAATDVSHLDGLRVEFRRGQPDDWWFSLRVSNTEPLLRLNLEARTVEETEKRKAELEALILR